MNDFYLLSLELRAPYEPRACKVLKRLKSEIRDDYALVQIDPPLPSETYDTERSISELILVSRYEGKSLFPFTESPTHVYICRLKNNILNSSEIDAEDIIIMDWGAAYRSEADATSALKAIFSK